MTRPTIRSRSIAITDRPVYRPGQPVRFKFWVGPRPLRPARRLGFAGKTFTVEIQNPKGEKIFTKNFEADDFGGFDGSFELPSDAALGRLPGLRPEHGGGSFRVEEYKKPEFEVNVEAPNEAGDAGREGAGDDQGELLLRLARRRGEGQVQDHPHRGRRPLVSRGPVGLALRPRLLVVRRGLRVVSRLVAVGLLRPAPWWWGRPEGPPEVVAEAEVPIRPDGTLAVEIDTALAKAAHPDQDHRTRSRPRSPTSRGGPSSARARCWSLASRSPSTPGSTAATTAPATRSRRASRAQTLDHKPVAGKGTLKLLKVTYDAERKPVETPVESWDLGARRRRPGRPDDQGRRARPVPALGHDRRRPGPRDRGRLPAHDRWARASTGRASGSTTWRSSPTRRSTSPARRSGS